MVTAQSRDLLRPRLWVAALCIITLCATMVAGITWSRLARVVEASAGEGRVIPSGRVKTVQSVDGGIVRAIMVEEGQRVALGAPLVAIDTAQADATLNESRVTEIQLAISALWMSAIMEERTVVFDKDDWPDQQIQRARSEYRSTLEAHRAAIEVLEKTYAKRALEIEETRGRLEFARQTLTLSDQRLTMLKGLQQSGAASRESVLSARSDATKAGAELKALELALPRLAAGLRELETQKRETRASFRAEISTRLSKTQAQLDQLREAQAGERDAVARAVLRAPSAGIIKTVFPAAPGEVVQPAQPVIEVLPVDDDLLIRTRIDPKDIAFIAPDLTATIRLTAYDYAAFGALSGKVARIGVDSVTDENGHTYYPVDVKVEQSALPNGRDLPILPGMVAQVHIVTGEKSVFDYLTKPIHRTVTTALRER